MGDSEEMCAKFGKWLSMRLRSVQIGCPFCACRRLESFEVIEGVMFV